MDRIKELYAEIERLEKENKESLKDKYQYLVGKCLHYTSTSYEKITKIIRINVSKDGEEIVYDCISLYYCNENASISTEGYGSIEEEDIEKYLISQEKFNEALNKCVEVFKNKINE